MAENLKTTHYSDGVALAEGTGMVDSFQQGDRYWFAPFDDIENNKDTYGLYYTWYASIRGIYDSEKIPSGIQGICPSGWHVPSSGEYEILNETLGGSDIAGGKLKINDSEFWNDPNSGATNSSGFSAKGSGYRLQYKDSVAYTEYIKSGFSSTATSRGVLYFETLKLYDDVEWSHPAGGHDFSTNACSVRCVKD